MSITMEQLKECWGCFPSPLGPRFSLLEEEEWLLDWSLWLTHPVVHFLLCTFYITVELTQRVFFFKLVVFIF